MSFGARLKEERRRLGLKQAELAQLVGTNMPTQSLYERNQRELRAAYLARLVPVGVDVGYVLTGRRSEAGPLGEEATAILSTYLGLPEGLRESVGRFVEGLGPYVEPGQGPTTSEDS